MIFCCGEALIDMLPRKLESGEDVFLPVSGGAVFNTAITLGRLGEKSAFVSGISTDMFGKQLLDSLASSKVDTTYCVSKENPSTLAFVKLSDGHAQYTFMDENSAGRMLAPGDLPDLPGETRALHFGAISLIPEPCGTAFETLMERCKDNAVISLDPNIRPGFIPDADAHRARIDRMIAMSDIVKVSDEDLAWLCPDLPVDQAIRLMLAKGVSVVVFTKGAEGVDIHTQAGSFEVPAQKAEVVDTVGAGDSFNGGFLAGMNRAGLLTKAGIREASHDDLRPAVELAAKVAAITVSRAGANPPWSHEI